LLRESHIVLKIFRDIFDAREYAEFYKETECYRKQLSLQWRSRNRELIPHLTVLGAITKQKHIFIRVLHPTLNVGSYLGKSTIEWGRLDMYPGYQVVGLAHEILHALTEHIDKDASEEGKWLLHGLIYLAADEAIRMRLGGKPRFFDRISIRHYDARLIRVARLLLPHWLKHCRRKLVPLKSLFSELRCLEPAVRAALID
jgi:hypothetical protein